MVDTPGQRIRGKLDPFKVILDPILLSVVTDEGFEQFREYLKDAVALRMHHTVYAPIEINDSCIRIINKYANNTCVFSFIRCSLRYYSNKKAHKIKSINTSCSCCKSKDPHKSLQHAKQDCLLCGKHYMRAIKKQMHAHNDIHLQNSCTDVEKAIKFVCEYICAIYEGTLPKMIKSSAYTSACKKDKTISTLYSYNKVGDFYFLSATKTKYSAISLTAATEIFCSGFIF